MSQPLAPAEFNVGSYARPGHTVAGRVDGANYHADLRTYRWDEPVEGAFLSASCMVQLTLRRCTLAPRALAIGTSLCRPTVPVGRVLLVPPNTPVRLRCEAGNADMLCCMLPPDRLAELGQLEWRRRALVAAMDVCSPSVASTLGRIAAEIRTPGLGSATMIESGLVVALVELCRHLQVGAAESASGGGLAPWQMRRIEQLVRDGVGGGTTIAELARACRLSPRHLMRLFKASTGQTLGRYLTEARIEFARQLLGEADMPIGQAAGHCGFRSAAAFAAAFRRDTGMTPLAFRRRLRAGR